MEDIIPLKKELLVDEQHSNESHSSDLTESHSSDLTESHSSDLTESHSSDLTESQSDFSSDVLAEASFKKKCRDKFKDAFSSRERISTRTKSSPLITKSSPELSPVLPRAVSYAFSSRSPRNITPSVNRRDSRECLSSEGSRGILIKTNSFMRDYYDSFLITSDGVCKGLSKLSTLEIVQAGFCGVRINDGDSFCPQDNSQSVNELVCGQNNTLNKPHKNQTSQETFYIVYSRMKMNAILIPSIVYEIEYSLEEILDNKSEWFPFYVKAVDMKYTEQDFKHVFLLLINTLKDNIGLKKRSNNKQNM
jgi:hypothetical protein